MQNLQGDPDDRNIKCQNFYSYMIYTECGRNNSHILKVNKNKTKQGTQKILLFIKTTYDAIFFKHF